MQIKEFKCGTKEEIIKYLKEKIKATVKTLLSVSLEEMNDGDIFEVEDNSIEHQIDQFIEAGSPLVAISLPQFKKAYGLGGFYNDYYREQFIIDDFPEVKVQMEIKKLDDEHSRKRKDEAIRRVAQMIDDAKKRETLRVSLKGK